MEQWRHQNHWHKKSKRQYNPVDGPQMMARRAQRREDQWQNDKRGKIDLCQEQSAGNGPHQEDGHRFDCLLHADHEVQQDADQKKTQFLRMQGRVNEKLQTGKALLKVQNAAAMSNASGATQVMA